MRSFSDLEKKIIEKLIELHDAPGSLNILGNILAFLYEDGLPDYCYIKIESPSDVSIQIMESALDEGSVPLQEIENDLFKKVILIIALFDYLGSEKLAYFVGDLDLNSLGTVCNGKKYIR